MADGTKSSNDLPRVRSLTPSLPAGQHNVHIFPSSPLTCANSRLYRLVFCIGLSAFTAFLEAFKTPTTVLAVVAAAFPKGATFFGQLKIPLSCIYPTLNIILLPGFLVASCYWCAPTPPVLRVDHSLSPSQGAHHGLQMSLFGIPYITHRRFRHAKSLRRR